MSRFSLKHFLVIFPILFVSIFLFVYIHQTPQYSGIFLISRADLGEISIYRDQWAIPHVKAKSFRAAIYGLAFVHAQDRLFSTYFKKLVATGRLSEYLGEKALGLDIFLRKLGVQ